MRLDSHLFLVTLVLLAGCSSSGEHSASSGRPDETKPIEDSEVDVWRDTSMELHTAKMSESDARDLLEQVAVSWERPYFTHMVIDALGNLWVELEPANWQAPGEIEYLVFDRDGLLLGSVAVPPLEVLEIGADYVVGIYRDEMDVEYLRVHDIRKPRRGDRRAP